MPIIRSEFGAVLLEGAHASPRIGVDHQIHSGERGQCENKEAGHQTPSPRLRYIPGRAVKARRKNIHSKRQIDVEQNQ
ncbi:hypothetical protein ARMSODRAFT_951094 [Armillaria solidipes]|uniref:Uncharacterized protein n=1 Tax=Armillaria solidipes TaxID=1076256 RepID=A0A2H3CE11_9AGAR|nr:hypothetical protein ARMSODRAFT_951094 [Armillaria solidipes]